MSVMTAKQLNSAINRIKTSRERFQEAVHEALISCAYFAMKDANITPFNLLLKAVGNATHVKGITMWAETCGAPVLVRDGQFAYNKAASKQLHVTDEATFAEYEIDMRTMPKWYEIAGKQKPESVFDCPKYLDGVYKRLEKEGQKEVADVIRKAIALANFQVVEIDA